MSWKSAGTPGMECPRKLAITYWQLTDVGGMSGSEAIFISGRIDE
jgi:hypothetical protein